MKSIKQISEQTGISKVSLYKLIRKPELQEHLIKDKNATFIDDVGEQIIIEYYARQRLASLNDILDENTSLQEYDYVNKTSLPDNEISSKPSLLDSDLDSKPSLQDDSSNSKLGLHEQEDIVDSKPCLLDSGSASKPRLLDDTPVCKPVSQDNNLNSKPSLQVSHPDSKPDLQNDSADSKPSLQADNSVKSIDIMQILENQLKEKDNQLQAKDEQIRQKDNQLNALLVLLNKEKDIKLIGDDTTYKADIPAAESAKGFFKRLFRKK